jgi:hypothetical protein
MAVEYAIWHAAVTHLIRALLALCALYALHGAAPPRENAARILGTPVGSSFELFGTRRRGGHCHRRGALHSFRAYTYLSAHFYVRALLA